MPIVFLALVGLLRYSRNLVIPMLLSLRHESRQLTHWEQQITHSFRVMNERMPRSIAGHNEGECVLGLEFPMFRRPRSSVASMHFGESAASTRP